MFVETQPAGTALSRRVLDPLERSSEVLFGLIMVLTFTSSLSVAEGGEADVGTVLRGAIGCNLAWGLVDAMMYLMSNFMGRARSLATYKAIRGAADPETAHRLIREALGSVVAIELSPSEVEGLRERLNRQQEPDPVRLTATDLLGAVGVFLLVFLSTFPVIVPFLVMREPGTALRTSNAVAMIMLFGAGWSLGKYAGRPAWRTGLGMVAVGIVLVGITMALGG